MKMKMSFLCMLSFASSGMKRFKMKETSAYLEFFIAVAQCCHLVVSVSSNQFTQRANQLIISDTVHVHLLFVVLQALQPSEVRVWHGLDKPVSGERLLVWVSCPEAFLTV